MSLSNHVHTHFPPHSQLSQAGGINLPAPDPSFCARCRADIREARVTVRIEGKVYCWDCEGPQEDTNEGLDALFNEAREADYEQAPVGYDW